MRFWGRGGSAFFLGVVRFFCLDVGMEHCIMIRVCMHGTVYYDSGLHAWNTVLALGFARMEHCIMIRVCMEHCIMIRACLHGTLYSD